MNSKVSKDTKSERANMSSPWEGDFEAKDVTLTQDVFGYYYDETDTLHIIKRFTWKNRNKIQVQVINYGARVTSIKMPDRKGEIEDIVLGFDDVAGYLVYGKYYFGSIIGRYSNIIKNSAFYLEDQLHKVHANKDEHCFHGGRTGFDKIVWDTYICGKKVIMSHVSRHLSSGFPGDLLTRITFELSGKNEFRISMDAQSTLPTIINISHLLYFNLAGHYAGPEQMYKHMLTMNCNCFTPLKDGIPTGDILNVIHSPYDFQVPKLLGKVIGIKPKDGIDQNLCVNRGMFQGECFIGRLLHIPSGRMVEVYSNQPGVQLTTGNEFGYGQIRSIEGLVPSRPEMKMEASTPDMEERQMLIYQKVHEKVVELLNIDKEQNFDDIRNLITKFQKGKNNDYKDGIKFTDLQIDYLTKAREIVCENEETDDECLDLKETLSAILKLVVKDNGATRKSSLFKKDEKSLSSLKRPSGTNENDDTKKSLDTSRSSKKSVTIDESETGSKVLDDGVLEYFSPKPLNDRNNIPPMYRNVKQIKGKGGALYKSHGGLALQTQNYPNAPNTKNFPNCILNPGQVYKHDIVYRFWVRAGNPAKWLKRNANESLKKNCK